MFITTVTSSSGTRLATHTAALVSGYGTKCMTHPSDVSAMRSVSDPPSNDPDAP